MAAIEGKLHRLTCVVRHWKRLNPDVTDFKSAVTINNFEIDGSVRDCMAYRRQGAMGEIDWKAVERSKLEYAPDMIVVFVRDQYPGHPGRLKSQSGEAL